MRKDLKIHLIKIHKWSKKDADAARNNFQLNKQRELKPQDERKSKPRPKRTIVYQCPMKSCRSEVKRPKNHLRQIHKIKDPHRLQRKYKKFRPVMPLPDENKENESFSSSQYSSEEDVVVLFFKAYHPKCMILIEYHQKNVHRIKTQRIAISQVMKLMIQVILMMETN